MCNTLKDVPLPIVLFLGYYAPKIVKLLKAEGDGKDRHELTL